MTYIIQTTKNKTYKYIKSLQQKKIRSSERLFTVEGIKSVSDAYESGKSIRMAVISESFFLSGERERFEGPETVIVKDELFGGLCDTKTPQGIIAVMEMFGPEELELSADKLYIYCDRVSDPGNIGTIIRTADAAGFGGVMLSKGCAELYSPKTVRASMGSFFHIPVRTDMEPQELISLKECGFKLYAGALSKDSKPYTTADMSAPSVIIVGNEANGVCDEILEESEHIIIPIYGRAESLNVGAAAAVLMYEAVRNRDERINERCSDS